MELFGFFVEGRNDGLVLDRVACAPSVIPYEEFEKIGTCEVEASAYRHRGMFESGILPDLICFPDQRGTCPVLEKWYELKGYHALPSRKACVVKVGREVEKPSDDVLVIWRRLNTRYGRCNHAWVVVRGLPGYHMTGRRGTSRVSRIYERI